MRFRRSVIHDSHLRGFGALLDNSFVGDVELSPSRSQWCFFYNSFL